MSIGTQYPPWHQTGYGDTIDDSTVGKNVKTDGRHSGMWAVDRWGKIVHREIREAVPSAR